MKYKDVRVGQMVTLGKMGNLSRNDGYGKYAACVGVVEKILEFGRRRVIVWLGGQKIIKVGASEIDLAPVIEETKITNG